MDAPTIQFDAAKVNDLLTESRDLDRRRIEINARIAELESERFDVLSRLNAITSEINAEIYGDG